MKKLFVFTLALFSAVVAGAKVQLPQMFQNGMVLQRGMPIPVWGTADPGERVSVWFRKKVYETVAGDDGTWKVMLPQQKAGGPFQLVVNDQTIDDCLIGDVWLCSGQSNIDVTIERVYPQ